MTTININLLPEELRARKGGGGLSLSADNLPPKEALIPIGAGLLAAIVLALTPFLLNTMWLDPRAASAQAQEDQITLEIKKYNTSLDSLKRMATQKESLRKQLAMLQMVAGGQSTLPSMLNELRALTPANLWFDSMKTDTLKGSVTVSGSALDYTSVAYFHRNLSHSEYFGNPVLQHTDMSVATNGVSVVKFDLTVDVKKKS